ncbi:MAG TPA: hypothetical protein VM013_05970 [Dehalococcoidia bacterium]|nr:hypothetical protein [Dehalococcoidia bacterium]
MSAAERRDQRLARRFHQTVEAQLAEIERLEREAFRARRQLCDYIADPDWPGRRQTFDEFESAGGETAAQWAGFVRGEWPRRSIARRRLRTGPELIWVNPRPPQGEEKEKR